MPDSGSSGDSSGAVWCWLLEKVGLQRDSKFTRGLGSSENDFVGVWIPPVDFLPAFDEFGGDTPGEEKGFM